MSKVPGTKVAVRKEPTKNWIYLAYLFNSLMCESKLVLDGCLKTWRSSRSESRRALWRLMWDIGSAGRAGAHVEEKPKQDDKKLTCAMRSKSQTGGRENGSTWLAQSSRISVETQTIQKTSVPSREVAQINPVDATPPNTLLPKNPPDPGGLRALHLQSPAHLRQYSPDGLFPFTK